MFQIHQVQHWVHLLSRPNSSMLLMCLHVADDTGLPQVWAHVKICRVMYCV